MVQNGSLGRAGRWAVVVTGDCVEELGEDGRVEIPSALLDHPQSQVHVSEQAPFLGLAKGRGATELANAADVVQERCCQEQIGPQARMELRGLATERRYADRVLEQTARVAVVAVRAGRGKRPEGCTDLRVAYE